MSMRPLVCAVFLLPLLAAGPALALDVYLNNVKVTGSINSQSFQDVSVRIAANGDVYIDAPGYKVEVEDAAATTGAVSTGKYWFFMEAKHPNQYAISVSVNGKPVVEIPGASAQWVIDLGPHLTRGANQMHVTFNPVPNTTKIVAPEVVSILVGEGSKAADGTLTIGRVIKTLKQPGGKQGAEAYPLSFTLP